MNRRILVRGARQLITLRGPRGPRRGRAMRQIGVVQDGALLIENGLIQTVGPARRVENLAAARDAVELDADGKVVMPGFVDPFAHLVRGPALLDGYEAGVDDDWRVSLSRALGSFSTNRMELEARKVLRQFMRHGTTTIEAKTGVTLDTKTELKTLRAVGGLRDHPLTLRSTFYWAKEPTREDTESLSGILGKLRKNRLADFVEVLCAEGGVEQARGLLTRAMELGLQVKIASADAGSGAAVIAAEFGAPAVDFLAGLPRHEMETLAKSETVATLLPGAAFHQRIGHYPPARQLTETGTAFAIATGFSSHMCPTCSMPAVLSIACSEMGLTPAEAITASTINAAYAIGLADRVGSLEAGKDADLIMLNAADYREIPYHFGMNLLAMSMKRGDVIYPRLEQPQ